MRWRFLDRIDQFDEWASIEGRKSISLEEYSLLKPLGRKGCFPESLIVESCVHLARWLVAASSGFERTGVLQAVDHFCFDREVGPGSVLTLSLSVADRQATGVRLDCRIVAGAHPVSRGTITLALLPLHECAVDVDMRALWQELYGKA